MKITEITEGYTNEGWGEFKQAAKGAAGAVGRGAAAVGRAAGKAGGAAAGAAGRQMRDVGNTAMAKMGFNKAKGAKEMQRVVGGVIANFNRYLGQTKSKPTQAALQQYLKALGFQNPVLSESPVKGDKIQGSDGDTYTWHGAQWISDKTGRVAKKDVGAGATQSANTVLTRNQLFDIIGKNITMAMKAGTLPKELKKFLGQ